MHSAISIKCNEVTIFIFFTDMNNSIDIITIIIKNLQIYFSNSQIERIKEEKTK